jgi:hypothetical protein
MPQYDDSLSVAGLQRFLLKMSARDGFPISLVKATGAYNSLITILDETKRFSLASGTTSMRSA